MKRAFQASENLPRNLEHDDVHKRGVGEKFTDGIKDIYHKVVGLSSEQTHELAQKTGGLNKNLIEKRAELKENLVDQGYLLRETLLGKGDNLEELPGNKLRLRRRNWKLSDLGKANKLKYNLYQERIPAFVPGLEDKPWYEKCGRKDCLRNNELGLKGRLREDLNLKGELRLDRGLEDRDCGDLRGRGLERERDLRGRDLRRNVLERGLLDKGLGKGLLDKGLRKGLIRRDIEGKVLGDRDFQRRDLKGRRLSELDIQKQLEDLKFDKENRLRADLRLDGLEGLEGFNGLNLDLVGLEGLEGLEDFSGLNLDKNQR